MSTNLSKHTQFDSKVVQNIKNNFYRYKNTPFTFIETSHRSKQYDQLNSNTLQTIKQYFNANQYNCMLMPSGSAIPSIFMNFITQDSNAIFYVLDNLSDQKYKQMGRYHKNTTKVTQTNDLSAILQQNDSIFNKKLVHLNQINLGKYLTVSIEKKIQNSSAITVKNLNYCFPWLENKKLNCQIAYFQTQTGFSIPGFTVFLINKSLFESMKTQQNCPDMLNLRLMYEKNSIVNTPFTLCTICLNQNIKYALENRIEMVEKIRKNKAGIIKLIQKDMRMKLLNNMNERQILKVDSQSQCQNMLLVEQNDACPQIYSKVNQKNCGLKLSQNKYCLFIQSANQPINSAQNEEQFKRYYEQRSQKLANKISDRALDQELDHSQIL